MSWTPLSHRIARLPLILAGPILRRTEPDAVTVWVALKKQCEVTLGVYSTDPDNGLIVNELILAGSRHTVALGKYLHVVAITAKPVEGYSLQPGQIYAYNLNFAGYEGGLIRALNSAGFPSTVTVSYFEHQLPTFALPPDDLNDLKIVHGSCRKPHGGGRDALTILDDLIEQQANQPNARLHQLFLTGDQIYGDDVADPMLWIATEAGNTLLGWEEDLPFGNEYKKPSELKPGQRSDIAKDYGGFTAMLVNKPEKAKSHLFSLGEFYAIYLLVWSPILWPPDMPQGEEIHQDAKQAKLWNQEAFILHGFARDLWKIRRAMANVPTYTIFDDHDISDDWYLNREWCDRVLSKPLGRRTVQNGLLAYAVFQAWGNTPEQFQPSQPGGTLLEVAAQWSESAGTDNSAWLDVAKCLGLPLPDPETGLPQMQLDEDVLILDRNYWDGSVSIDWNYTIRSFKHEVIVLDTRTWRGYPNGRDNGMNPPMLLSPTAFKKQIRQSLELTDRLNRRGESRIEATLVVLPTNLVHLSAIDFVQQLHLNQGKVFGSDVGDSWNFHEEAFTRLLAELFRRRDRIIILSGDIHYSCAVRLSYWFRRHFGDEAINPDAQEQPKVLAQLTSSAFKNAEWMTNVVHTKIKQIFPEPSEDWLGWNDPPQLLEIQILPDKQQILELKLPDKKPILRQVKGTRGNTKIAWEIAIKDKKSLPDWRYHIEWAKRETAQQAAWQVGQATLNSSPQKQKMPWFKQVEDKILLLWRNQWLQEGEEVIGHSNLSLVTFQWSNYDEKAVIQDVYWYPSWQPNSVVFSRYFVSLRLDAPPPLPCLVL